MTNTYIAGALVTAATYTGPASNPTGGFRGAAGTLTDPLTVTFRYRTSMTGPIITITSLVASLDPRIAHDGPGLFHTDLDTTGSPDAVWAYAWSGTGVVQAVAAAAFAVREAFP